MELLTRIFTFYQEVLDNLNPSLPHPSWLPKWLAITHVCRHWRTIALSHAPLWTSITHGLSLHWAKVFIERSQSMLMHFDIHIAPLTPQYTHIKTWHYREDIVPLLTDFTRVRSLCLTGRNKEISPVVDSLRRSLPVQSFSLCLVDNFSGFVLPDDLFGGKAPIHRLQLVGGHIVAPHRLLHNVTNFTTSEPSLSELLNTLRHMSSLTYFELQRHPYCKRPDVDKVHTLPIQMPQLMALIVGSNSPDEFMLLNRLLLLPVGAKKRLELKSGRDFLCFEDPQINGLSQVIEAANGFQHIHFSGAQNSGSPWFRLWTGDVVTTWEDAEFCLCVRWKGEPGLSREHLHRFTALCDALGAAQVRRFVFDSPFPGLPMLYWWNILNKLPGIEELVLYPASMHILGRAWEADLAPAVLPALRRVRVMDSEQLGLPWPQYAIVGDPPTRRIVRLSNSPEDDVSFAENEIEIMSKGLLRLLQGLGRDPNSVSKKQKGRRAQG